MPGFAFECEYAKSARATCKQCKEKIDKGALRLGLKIVASLDGEADAAARQQAHAAESTKWHHADCFPQVRGAAWFRKHLPESVETCAGFGDLAEADRARVVALFATCRGAAPGAGDTPCKTPHPGKKRSAGAEAEEQPSGKQARVEAAGVLTGEQLQAIEVTKAELSKKNAAMLGALLAKNGLPKTGRKEDLLERAAECRVLGVPPTCATCSKARLKWSRVSGAFSCPGFFDEEEKRFKRCKGPGEGDDLARTPWQELGA